ncbi:GlsB/YeaQ/YmgE family stress response membrane protein [Breoghania sp.]|uniref:GlsB/YeaQ/YmgE family stress response membrane protein n=1 Tax=Breoghania sp. TaxID=2065378 RepID=UPI002AA8B6E3|nr:GlsB/YeaQ/YmgE family stress response membrane protein [Breoghania sp.]
MIGFGWISTILFGALAGWIASKIMKADHGLLMNILIGILGSVIANAILFRVLGLSMYGYMGGRGMGMGFGMGFPGFMLVWQLGAAVAGACGLIFLVRAIRN